MIPSSSKFVLLHTLNGERIPSYIKKEGASSFTSWRLLPLESNRDIYEHYYISLVVAQLLKGE